MSELRWNPLLGEWVATATHRQQRTFLPPADFCPLCPTEPGGFPTEVPESSYDRRYENRSLRCGGPEDLPSKAQSIPGEAGGGRRRGMLIRRGTLRHSPRAVEQIYKLVQVWTDRFRELSALEFVPYVLSSRTGRGHRRHAAPPHGNLRYPFTPPHIIRQLEQSRAPTKKLSLPLSDITPKSGATIAASSPRTIRLSRTFRSSRAGRMSCTSRRCVMSARSPVCVRRKRKIWLRSSRRCWLRSTVYSISHSRT